VTKEKTMSKKQSEKKTASKKAETKTKASVARPAEKPAAAGKKKAAPPMATEATNKPATEAAAGPTPAEVTPRTPDPRLPAAGTVLQKRDRHGAVRCECTVEDGGGIRYAGKVYRSLSSAAMAAAKDLGLGGKTQNGFTFWGLSKPPRRESDPLAALDRAWERYHGNVEALVKEGVTDENRSKVVSTIRKHAQVIESLREKVA
jgi:hypothetical protein